MRVAPFRGIALHRNAIGISAALFFFLAGQPFIPRLGIQNDEALFAVPLYQSGSAEYYHRLGHTRIPLMLMSYLGTLKTLLYEPLFKTFGTGPWTLREPALVAGALSVWLFFLLLRRAAGGRAALIGCCLLATDSLYLLTVCFDWGPVALQHLLPIAGALLALRFAQTRSEAALAGSFLLFGLALWDKALAICILSGAAVAVLAVFPREAFRLFTVRRAAIAASAFTLGALPLILYNLHSHMATLHQNAARDTSSLAIKVGFIPKTLDGGGLLSWLNEDNWQTPAPHKPEGLLEESSTALADFTGDPRSNLTIYAMLLALLAAPFAGRGAARAVLFCLVTFAVAWIQMITTANAGGTIHHSILLWPLPQAIIAISFAGASRRLGRKAIPVLATALALIAVPQVLVTNEYLARIVRNGGTPNWTGAVFTLRNYLDSHPFRIIYCMDWGFSNTLTLLDRGKLPLAIGSDALEKAQLTDDDRRYLDAMIAQPGAVYIGHVKDAEFFLGVTEKLIAYAAAEGYRPRILREIGDGYGRPMFRIYAFSK